MDDSHYVVQKVEIRNNIPLEEAKSKYKRITKRNAKKVRETKNFYHFRLQMPSRFVKGSFRSKKVNNDIVLIVGELKPEFQHLSGGGFGDYFKRAYSAVSGAVSSVGNKIVNAFTIHDYSSKTKRNLELYGDLPVIALEIRRKPLNIAIELAFQGVSAGQWADLKKKYGFDKFYHLSAVVTLKKEDTKQMAFEKLEVISFNDNIGYKEGDGTEILPVEVTKSFTVAEMFDKTRKTVGDDRFFSYSGVGGNNCQDFIAMCLTSVGLYGAKEKAFTYQDMKALTDELPLKVKAVARGVTQIGAIANKFLGIGGNQFFDEEYENEIPHSLNSIVGGMKGKIDEKSLRKDKILDLIHRRITPRKKQKAEKGEVFTPIEFIEDMLSHLPKSVWSNHNLKWLDPANGIGNFPVVVFYKLDEGLKAWEPNENKRRKHIIENMLYMLEIQSNNSRVARNIFEKLCDKCQPNILTTDSLKITAGELIKKGFPDKYDVIIGNPPFNAGGLLKGGGTLWPLFVKKAFELVEEDGYICFVHPPGWRKFYDAEDRDNQGKLWYIIRENGWNLDYVNVSDQPPKHFPIVDYYVIHAKKTNKPTNYDSKFMGITDSGETILDYPFIPNMLNDETMGILKKLFDAKGEPIHIIRNQSFQPSKADEDKSGTPHYHFTDKGGKKHIFNKQYASVPEYINKDKVLLTFSNGYEKGRLFAFYSDENYGTTGSTMYMLTKSKAQGDKLVKFFNSDIITFLMKITQYSASPNHKNEFKILNQLQVPDSLDYGLTAKEEELIKVIVRKADEPAEGGAKQRRWKP